MLDVIPEISEMIKLYDGWYLNGPCPYCEGKTRWKRNLLHFEDKSVLDVGHFECTGCGESSELHRLKLEPVEKSNR